MKTFNRSFYFAIALLMANLFLINNASGQTTLARFGLNGNLNFSVNGTAGTPVASATGLTSSSSTPPCEGSAHYYADNSDGADFLQININTTGFTSITISWQQKQSNSGGNGSWNLSGDANNDGTYEYSKNNNAVVTGSCATIAVTLDNTFNNKSAIRLRLTSNITGGQYLIVDDVTITGTAIVPTLTAGALTGFGNVCLNTTAGPNSFTITGTDLTTANVTVAALNGYTYSTTAAGTYTPSLSLTQSGGSYSQTIFVKVSPTLVQSYNGSIVVGGGGASNVNVTATANGSALPTASAVKNDVLCFGTTTGQITVSGSGGSGTYNFFSINNGTNYQASNLFTGLGIGTYKIRVKDSNGCESKSVQ